MQYDKRIILQKQRPIKHTVYIILDKGENPGFKRQIAETSSAEDAQRIVDAFDKIRELEEALANTLSQFAYLSGHGYVGDVSRKVAEEQARSFIRDYRDRFFGKYGEKREGR